MKALSEYLNIEYGTLQQRINKGLPQEEWGKDLKSYTISYKGKEFESIAKKVRPSAKEIELNNRSRSAIMRVFKKL